MIPNELYNHRIEADTFGGRGFLGSGVEASVDGECCAGITFFDFAVTCF